MALVNTVGLVGESILVIGLRGNNMGWVILSTKIRITKSLDYGKMVKR
jgi:hypothetical protein